MQAILCVPLVVLHLFYGLKHQGVHVRDDNLEIVKERMETIQRSFAASSEFSQKLMRKITKA